MRSMKLFALLCCVGFLLIAFAPSARASAMDKKTYVTFREAVELPNGVMLYPGEYTMRVISEGGSGNVVQFLNREETEVLATVFSIYTERMEPKGETVIALREAPVGKPRTMESWFYPGTLIGREFPEPRK